MKYLFSMIYYAKKYKKVDKMKVINLYGSLKVGEFKVKA